MQSTNNPIKENEKTFFGVLLKQDFIQSDTKVIKEVLLLPRWLCSNVTFWQN